jgi:hypothetical protein
LLLLEPSPLVQLLGHGFNGSSLSSHQRLSILAFITLGIRQPAIVDADAIPILVQLLGPNTSADALGAAATASVVATPGERSTRSPRVPFSW